MVKFLFLNLLYAATTLGFSMRQGLHQLAQKSTNTYFPRKELSFISFPFTSGMAISGASFPTQPSVLAVCASSVLFMAATPWCEGNLDAVSFTILVTSSMDTGSSLNPGLLAVVW